MLENFHTYPQDEKRGLGARTEITLLTKEQILESKHQCMVAFAGAVSEEMDYYGTGKATEWGPTYVFQDIRFRIENMDYLVRTDLEVHFQELYQEARRLFKDEQGDETILWLRTIAIGKVLYRLKNMSEGECRKIYNSVQEVRDRRYPTPDPWPKLRYNVDEEFMKKYQRVN